MWSAFLLLCFAKLVVPQNSHFNCLQKNPEALDAVLSLIPRKIDKYNLRSGKINITEYFSLYRSRFNQAHELDPGLSFDDITDIGNAAKEFSRNSGKNISLFLMTEFPEGSSDEPRPHKLEKKLKISFQSTLAAVEVINSGNTKPIVGLYMNSKYVSSYERKLRAVLEVFGPKESSAIQIGEYLNNCTDVFNSNITAIHKYLNRLNYISCKIEFDKLDNPDANIHAGRALLECGNTKKAAEMKGISAEIFCVLEYNSESSLYPTMSSKYYLNFRTFWCNIVERTKDGSYPRIVLLSAFPYYFATLSNGVPFSTSWWKRTNESSYSSGAYIEKVPPNPEPLNSSNSCMQSNCSSLSTELDDKNSLSVILQEYTIEEKDGPECSAHKEPLCKSNVSNLQSSSILNQSEIFTPTEYYSVYDKSSLNCLKRYPNALDAHSAIKNKNFDVDNITGLDILKLADILSTRFGAAHEMTSSLGRDFGLVIASAIKFSGYQMQNNFSLFFKTRIPSPSSPYQDEYEDFKTTVKYYEESLQFAEFINSLSVNMSNGLSIAGLYLSSFRLKSYDLKLTAAKKVFGLKNNSKFPIGEVFTFTCFEALSSSKSLDYIRRLDFLACEIHVDILSTPESLAVTVLGECEKIQDKANSLQINTTIRCVYQYTYGGNNINTDVNVNDVDGFQKFWCKIVQNVVSKTYPKFIMWSAFDMSGYMDSFDSIKGSALIPRYHSHSGWWRRTHSLSYEAGAFVEKVEELKGSKIFPNCSNLCEECNSTKLCCLGTCQLCPYSNNVGHNTDHWVCKQSNTLCDDFYPLSTQGKFPAQILKSPASESSPHVTPWYSESAIFISSLTVGTFILFSFLLFIGYRVIAKRNLNDIELHEFLNGSSSVKRIDGKELSIADSEFADSFSYSNEHEVPDSNFEIYEDKILGQGAFGMVVEGSVNGKLVAVKMLLPGSGRPYLKSLISELKLLSFLGQHENIVNLVGANTSQLKFHKLFIFLELCPLGNLLQYLRDQGKDLRSSLEITVPTQTNIIPSDGLLYTQNKRLIISKKNLLKWSIQITDAMSYLAEKKVIHGDIAARNILVFSIDQLKLTDFGLSRRLYNYSNYLKKNTEPLPWRHMSPEALRHLTVSLKSDVWSFGVTLWEMFTFGEVPFKESSISKDFIHQLEEGCRPLQPKDTHEFIYQIMKSCWTMDPMVRPSIQQVRAMLLSTLDNIFSYSYYRGSDSDS